jgi:hypothetical protein
MRPLSRGKAAPAGGPSATRKNTTKANITRNECEINISTGKNCDVAETRQLIPIEFTGITSNHGDITKTIELDEKEKGKVISHGGGKIWSGKMFRVRLSDWTIAANTVNEMPGYGCLSTGMLIPGCPDSVDLVTTKIFNAKSEEKRKDYATRTKKFLEFRNVPMLGFIDHDVKRFPEHWPKSDTSYASQPPPACRIARRGSSTQMPEATTSTSRSRMEPTSHVPYVSSTTAAGCWDGPDIGSRKVGHSSNIASSMLL